MSAFDGGFNRSTQHIADKRVDRIDDSIERGRLIKGNCMKTPSPPGCKKWRPLMPLVGKSLCLTLLLGAVCALQGCKTDNRPAPTPTPNPHPQKTLKLLITVEPSLVDRVEVSTQWVVTNLGCAPVQPISGAARVKQIDVKEHVEKMGENYVATIAVDRFLPDSCHWSGGTAGIRFFHGNYWLTVLGVNGDVMRGERKDVLTCITRPFTTVGTCGSRDDESFFKKEDKNAFNATVELIK